MGLKTVFTDHSLFGFADLSSIIVNKILEYALTNVDHVVCVSHTSKENTVLRARLPPERISTIPNAVDCAQFQPDKRLFYNNSLTVVVMSRLVYRKGADLLAAIIPEICAKYPKARFIIGGDGPKRILLEEVRERQGLQERVFMLGTLPHSQVRDVLVQGQIFLNTSLTEAFCMAIVEAASCGLHVVSTRVGGIPEVLPPDMATLADPSAKSLIQALDEAIELFHNGKLMEPMKKHERVVNMYYWPDIAERTEIVYDRIMESEDLLISDKLHRYFRSGYVFGTIFSLVSMLHLLIIRLLDLIRPKNAVLRTSNAE